MPEARCSRNGSQGARVKPFCPVFWWGCVDNWLLHGLEKRVNPAAAHTSRSVDAQFLSLWTFAILWTQRWQDLSPKPTQMQPVIQKRSKVKESSGTLFDTLSQRHSSFRYEAALNHQSQLLETGTLFAGDNVCWCVGVGCSVNSNSIFKFVFTRWKEYTNARTCFSSQYLAVEP